LSHRNGLIVALSLGIGLGFPSQTPWLATLPAFLRPLLESGIAAGGITALGLNLLLPGGRVADDEES
jgi:xanthine/uracil permease